MAELVLKYSDLSSMAKYARKTASECDSYVSELNRKLTNKWGSVPPSPMSDGNGRINSASYYVKQKIGKLNNKSSSFRSFAGKVDRLQDNAKAADKNVAKTVNGSRESFLKAHENLRPHGFLAVIMEIPGLKWLADGINKIKEAWKDLKGNIRYWYDMCGGKKILDTALAVTGLVLAVVGAIVAVVTIGPFTSVFAAVAAIAGVVGAVIGVINAGANLWNQLRANGEEDPAWAQYYGNIDSASDTLRQHTFKSGFMNRFSSSFANAWDIVDTVCSIISIGDSIHKMYARSGLNKIFGEKKIVVLKEKEISEVAGKKIVVWKDKEYKIYPFKFSKFKDAVTSEKGWAGIKKALKVNWKGVLFGDKGGFKTWKKCFKRAYTQNTSQGWKKAKKIIKAFNSDFGKIDKMLKNLNTLIKSTSGGGMKKKDWYSTIKNNYSITGYKGAPKTGMDIYDTVTDIQDKLKERKAYLKRMTPRDSGDTAKASG